MIDYCYGLFDVFFTFCLSLKGVQHGAFRVLGFAQVFVDHLRTPPAPFLRFARCKTTLKADFDIDTLETIDI